MREIFLSILLYFECLWPYIFQFDDVMLPCALSGMSYWHTFSSGLVASFTHHSEIYDKHTH